MRIEISGQTSPALNEHVTKSLEAALGQHEAFVESVDVRLVDTNGPRGGEDQKCHLHIRTLAGGPVVIEEVNEDAYAAVSLAAERAKQTVGRKQERFADRRNGRESSVVRGAV